MATNPQGFIKKKFARQCWRLIGMDRKCQCHSPNSLARNEEQNALTEMLDHAAALHT